jgi:hypothetical protein
MSIFGNNKILLENFGIFFKLVGGYIIFLFGGLGEKIELVIFAIIERK